MDTCNSSVYYIYGIGSNNCRLDFIGCSNKQPEENKEEILCSLASGENISLKNWITDVRGRVEPDIFEIEKLVTKTEADEALDFWRDYWRFLGVQLINYSS